MKKPFLIMASLMATMATYAQSISETSEYKPKANTISTELNVNPFNGQINLNNSLNQIKLRYFTNAGFALRFGFNVSRRDSSINTSSPYGTNSYFYNNDKKSTVAGVNFGFEKHFTGTKRLSPYIGADISISNRSASQTLTDNSSTTTVKGGWYDYVYINNTTVVRQAQQPGYFKYGVNLLTGFDFYIAPHFYFGYEFNFSLAKTNWKNVEITVSGQNPTSPVNTSSTTKTESSTFNFGPTLMNGIRLGYNF